MAYIKKYKEIYESRDSEFGFDDHAIWLDKRLIQDIIDKMRPNANSDTTSFVLSLKGFNEDYPIREDRSKKLPSTFGKQAAEWIDMDLIQDVIDRLNPQLNIHNVEYKENLISFLEGE